MRLFNDAYPLAALPTARINKPPARTAGPIDAPKIAKPTEAFLTQPGRCVNPSTNFVNPSAPALIIGVKSLPTSIANDSKAPPNCSRAPLRLSFIKSAAFLLSPLEFFNDLL